MLLWQAPDKCLHFLRVRELIINGMSSMGVGVGGGDINTVTQQPSAVTSRVLYCTPYFYGAATLCSSLLTGKFWTAIKGMAGRV